MFEFSDQELGEAFKYFNTSLEKANETYSILLKIRDNLMEYGWKGNTSQNFYNNIANYIEQIKKLRDHLDDVIRSIEESSSTKVEVEEAANQTM